MTQRITAELIVDWFGRCSRRLELARPEIDALNVFPVPDGDTGTNVFLTIDNAYQAVLDVQGDKAFDKDRKGSASQILQAAAQGALLGARGNSGVILSQYLRGLAKGTSDEGRPPLESSDAAKVLAAGLKNASAAAYGAVGDPKEGTILSVAAATANVAVSVANSGRDFETVTKAMYEESLAALARTPEQLPVLKEAGVVDSGGRALVEMLAALTESVTGVEIPVIFTDLSKTEIASHEVGEDYSGPEYEVMYLLEAKDDVIPKLKDSLGQLGDSLVVVGGDELWNVHVHVDDAGAAIEEALKVGRPYRLKVTHLISHESHATEAKDSAPQSSEQQNGRGLVAVSHGPGIRAMLEELGLQVVDAVPGRRASTQELLDAIKASRAKQVILLPSDKDTKGVAEAASSHARQEGIRVAVIPTRAIVQTLAAVAVHDGNAPFDDDVASMGRASGATSYGAVTFASRDSQTSAGPCSDGDALGLVDGDIVVVAKTMEEAIDHVVDHMVRSSSELVTLVVGSDSQDAWQAQVETRAQSLNSMIEVEVIEGGQPLWPLILGVE